MIWFKTNVAPARYSSRFVLIRSCRKHVDLANLSLPAAAATITQAKTVFRVLFITLPPTKCDHLSLFISHLLRHPSFSPPLVSWQSAAEGYLAHAS